MSAEEPERETFGNLNSCMMYVHCGLCLNEVQELAGRLGKASPRDYARLSFGWTKWGLQIWCNRHDCNVVHVDFEGVTHPADTTRKGDA